MIKLIPVLLTLCCIAHGAHAADLLREESIAERLEETVFHGELNYLESGTHQFISIFSRSDIVKTRGAAIILHDRDANPDWVNVIQPLRIHLSQHGWETLSIQLPVASQSDNMEDWLELVPEALPRIDAARRFLEQRGLLNNVIVGHGLGALIAADYITKKDPETFQAFIGISMPGAQVSLIEDLEKIIIPTLDIYAERDVNSVISTIATRKIASQDAQNQSYTQVEIASARHLFNKESDQLVSRVRAWVNKTASGIVIKR